MIRSEREEEEHEQEADLVQQIAEELATSRTALGHAFGERRCASVQAVFWKG